LKSVSNHLIESPAICQQRLIGDCEKNVKLFHFFTKTRLMDDNNRLIHEFHLKREKKNSLPISSMRMLKTISNNVQLYHKTIKTCIICTYQHFCHKSYHHNFVLFYIFLSLRLFLL